MHLARGCFVGLIRGEPHSGTLVGGDKAHGRLDQAILNDQGPEFAGGVVPEEANVWGRHGRQLGCHEAGSFGEKVGPSGPLLTTDRRQAAKGYKDTWAGLK